MSIGEIQPFHTTHAQGREWAPGYEKQSRIPVLDSQSNQHPILKQLIDEALTRITLVSDGAIGSYEPPLEIIKHQVDRTDPMQRALADSGPHGHGGSIKGSREPRSDLARVIDEIAARYGACRTNRQRLGVIKDAQETADRLRFAPRSEQRGTVEWKQTIAADDRPSRIVASVYRISKRDVTAYRKQYR